jgi:hypothetical protein
VGVIVNSITQEHDDHSQLTDIEPKYQPSTGWALTKLMLFSDAKLPVKTINPINTRTDQIIV